VSRRPKSHNRPPSKDAARRGGQQGSIKLRVLRLLLVPSIVAVVLWLVASGYLVATGFVDRQVASSVRQVSIPAVTGLSSVQEERRLSIVYLTRPSKGLQSLIEQRKQTDQRLAALRTAADSALSLAPQTIKSRWKSLDDHLRQLPGIRSTIDSGLADRKHVYDFYNGLLDAATNLFDTQARIVPDVTATQGGLTATEVFEASDLMSRAGSIITGAFGSHKLTQDDYLEFTRLVGAYREKLSDVRPHLRPDAQQQYRTLLATDGWRRLTSAERVLITDGPWTHGVPRKLPVSATTWDTTTTSVSEGLIGLTLAQADQVSAEALRTGNDHLLTAGLGSLVALVIAAAAIFWAIRQSQVLVDRALSVRLAKLGDDASRVVDQHLPNMLARLRRQEAVDPHVELPLQDYGEDEIGQLAEVLNRSLQVAVGSAVEEATTRAAGIAMLMGVARRPQRPLQRSLRVVEDLQGQTDNDQQLAALFDINHGLAQTRRFLENLVILAGGQTGRRFNKPIPVRDVLLAAIGETRQYQRVQVRRTVDAELVGSAVASTTHLLAELLDNALAFSPPSSMVSVSCTEVPHGVVVEIEDAGVGMRDRDLARVNELLATAPTPEVTMLKDGAQIGLWVVAELAKRSGVQVTLRASAYGGLLAVVLLPQRLVSSGDAADGDTPDTGAESDPTAIGGHPGDPDHGSRPIGGMESMTSDRPVNGVSVDPPHTSMSATVVAADPQAADPPAAASHAARPPLPERRPQRHLAPQLGDGEGDAAISAEPGGPSRSPEENRHRLARYQMGWRAGLVEPPAHTTTSDDETGMRDGSDAAQ
jgi:signal transduction histidine kinase